MVSAISTGFRVLGSAAVHKVPYNVLDEIPRIVLPNSVRQELILSVSKMTKSPYSHHQEMSDDLGRIARSIIPRWDQERLKQMVYQESPYACRITNCPVTVTVPTPGVDRHDPKNEPTAEKFLLGLAHMLHADPFHAKGEKYGELFAQVVAVEGHEQERSSRGSLATFDLHTEHVHLHPSINFLSLLCLRGDPAAFTEIIPVGQFLQGLPSWIIDAMQEPIFEMSSRSSVDQTDQKRILPILESDGQGGYLIRYNSEIGTRVVGLNSLADHVLNHLQRQCSEIRDGLKVSLAPGDCLIINNRRVLHRRHGYVPTVTGDARRWLIRLYMTEKQVGR